MHYFPNLFYLVLDHPHHFLKSQKDQLARTASFDLLVSIMYILYILRVILNWIHEDTRTKITLTSWIPKDSTYQKHANQPLDNHH